MAKNIFKELKEFSIILKEHRNYKLQLLSPKEVDTLNMRYIISSEPVSARSLSPEFCSKNNRMQSIIFAIIELDGNGEEELIGFTHFTYIAYADLIKRDDIDLVGIFDSYSEDLFRVARFITDCHGNNGVNGHIMYHEGYHYSGDMDEAKLDQFINDAYSENIKGLYKDMISAACALVEKYVNCSPEHIVPLDCLIAEYPERFEKFHFLYPGAIINYSPGKEY